MTSVEIVEMIKEIKLSMAEFSLKLENLQSQIDELKSEDVGGVILDGCNTVIQNYITQDNKKDGDK